MADFSPIEIVHELQRDKTGAEAWHRYIDILAYGLYPTMDLTRRWGMDLYNRYADLNEGIQDIYDQAVKVLGKKVIPARYLAEDVRYIRALEAVIRFKWVEPQLHPVWTGTIGEERDKKLKAVDVLAKELVHAASTANGSAEGLRTLREEVIRYGHAGWRWYEVDGVLYGEVINHDCLWWDERYILIKREIRATSPEAEDYDWEPSNPSDVLTVYELWDDVEREVSWVGVDGGEVREAEEYPERLERAPIAIYRLGPDFGTGYPLGAVAPWVHLWEDLTVIHSVLNYWAWRSNQNKLFIVGKIKIDSQLQEQIESEEIDTVLIPTAGAVGEAAPAVNIHEFQRIGPVQHWVTEYQRIRQLLYEQQFMPEVLRGVRLPANTTATAVSEMTRGYDVFTAGLLGSARDFMEEAYRRLLDFMSAYGRDLEVVEKMPLEAVSILTRDYLISVSVDNLRVRDKDQERKRAMEFVQFAGASPDAYDMEKVRQYLHEAWDLPPYEYFKKKNLPASGGPGNENPGGGTPPPGGDQTAGGQGGPDAVKILEAAGFGSLAQQVSGLPPEIQQALGTRLMNLAQESEESFIKFVQRLDTAMRQADAVNEVVRLISGMK